MELNKTVFIVSIFGRGHWLAVACRRLGLNVTVLDLSSMMGNWGAEDAEGPFGFLKDEKLDESVSHRILATEAFDSIDAGFTILLKDGPVQFKSPLTNHRLAEMKVNKVVTEALAKGDSVSTLVEGLDFSESWPLHFACDFASTKWSPSALAGKRSMPAPLLSSFFVKSATRVGLESSLSWLKTFGVEVSTATEILDISFLDAGTVGGLELKGEISGLKKCDRLLWCLTSEESHYLSDRIAEKIWQKVKNESSWCWVRYQMKFEDSVQFQALPLHFVKIFDLYSPWTHENYLIFQKTKSSGIVDMWVKIPTVQRFNKDYLGYLGEKIKKTFTDQLSLFRSEVYHYPQEYNYTYAQLGPNRHPVYDLPFLNVPAFKNLQFSHPEVWDSYTWSARARYEVSCFGIVKNWWDELKLKEEKRLAKLAKAKVGLRDENRDDDDKENDL